MTRKAVLEQSLITSLARRQDVLAAFPFLRSIHDALAKGSCASCSSGQSMRDLVNRAKADFLSLTPAHASVLKGLLGVNEIEVLINDTAGNVQSRLL